MTPFIAYSIPIQGLKVGIHHFSYTLDREFFRHFEHSPIGEASLQVELEFDKRSDMLLLDFDLSGTIRTECDRCTAVIDLPVAIQRPLVVKYGDDEDLENDGDEVVFISREVSDFNVAPYLYEFAVLSLPITHTYDCRSEPEPPCNFETLNYLKNEEDEGRSGSIWDSLKDFDKKDDN